MTSGPSPWRAAPVKELVIDLSRLNKERWSAIREEPLPCSALVRPSRQSCESLSAPHHDERRKNVEGQV